MERKIVIRTGNVYLIAVDINTLKQSYSTFILLWYVYLHVLSMCTNLNVLHCCLNKIHITTVVL